MVQHIVPGLVTEDEDDLIGRQLLDGCVPDDHTLARAEALHVRIEGGHFGAGLHQEHALGGDVHVPFLHDPLQLRDQRGLGLLERLVVEEQRLDIRRGKDAEQHDRN